MRVAYKMLKQTTLTHVDAAQGSNEERTEMYTEVL